MKYYTKEWHRLMQNMNLAMDMQAVPDKEYTDEDIEKILDKYRKAIKGIQEQNFDPTPSKNSCAFCPYQNDLCVCNQ